MFLSVSYWHQCMADQNLQYTRELLKHLGIKYSKQNDGGCVSCAKGQIIRSSFQKSVNVAKVVGELTHWDLLTSPVTSLGGSKYALVLKDDNSTYRTVYFFKSKCFADYFNRIETQIGIKPKCLRSDNGMEEVNELIDRLCLKRGIIHELSYLCTPEQNGHIKCEMRTLFEAATTVLEKSRLGKAFWGEAMSYSAFT